MNVYGRHYRTIWLNENGWAVDIIDLDYPYWHTVADTADKVSAKSLQIVGETLLEWLKGFKKYRLKSRRV